MSKLQIILEISAYLISALSLIATFTKTKKDDTILKYLKDFVKRLLSAN